MPWKARECPYNACMAGRGNLLQLFPRISAAIVALIGISVLVGWTFDIEVLKRIVPGVVAMNPTTALLFLISATALWIGPTTVIKERRVFFICVAVVAVVSATKFLSVIIGWDSSIDRLIFPHKLEVTARVLPNWMAPNTALNLFVMSLALWFSQIPRRVQAAQSLGVVAFLISLLAMLGYAYGVRPLYGVTTFVPMALNTAFAFALLSLGLLFTKPHEGFIAVIWSNTVGGAMARTLLPAAITVPALLGWLRLVAERAGLFDAQVGVTLYTVASVTVFSAIVFWSARLLFAQDLVRQMAEREHLLSEEKFKAVSETARDAIISADAAGIITYCNHAAARMFGFSAAGLIGQSLDTLLQGFFDGVKESVAASDGEDVCVVDRTFDLSGRNRDNGEFPVELTMARWHSSQGHFLTVIVRDVTARVRAQAVLEQQRRELERSNSELEQFAYIASHDLQEPLRMVSSYMQLLSRRYTDVLDSDGQDFINYAVDGAVRMQRLIHDLLEYSRVGTKAKVLEPVELPEILDRVMANLSVALEEKNASVTRDELPTVDGDPVQLTQLFQNLIANAIKFQRDSIPHVHVSAWQRERDWVISVADNGIGIPPESFDRIFQIFQRLHGREEYAGTGIGLAVCKKIVERHGGEIWLESTVGEGTTFFFSISAENKAPEKSADEGAPRP